MSLKKSKSNISNIHLWNWMVDFFLACKASASSSSKASTLSTEFPLLEKSLYREDILPSSLVTCSAILHHKVDEPKNQIMLHTSHMNSIITSSRCPCSFRNPSQSGSSEFSSKKSVFSFLIRSNCIQTKHKLFSNPGSL